MSTWVPEAGKQKCITNNWTRVRNPWDSHILSLLYLSHNDFDQDPPWVWPSLSQPWSWTGSFCGFDPLTLKVEQRISWVTIWFKRTEQKETLLFWTEVWGFLLLDNLQSEAFSGQMCFTISCSGQMCFRTSLHKIIRFARLRTHTVQFKHSRKQSFWKWWVGLTVLSVYSCYFAKTCLYALIITILGFLI